MWNRNNSILQVVLTESSSPCFIKEEKGNSVFIARISSHLKWKWPLFGGWLSWCLAHSTVPVPLSLCIFLICSLPTGRTYVTYLSMDLLEYPWHYYTHFIDKETEAQRSWASCWSLWSQIKSVSVEYGLSFVTILFDLGIGTFDLWKVCVGAECKKLSGRSWNIGIFQ